MNYFYIIIFSLLFISTICSVSLEQFDDTDDFSDAPIDDTDNFSDTDLTDFEDLSSNEKQTKKKTPKKEEKKYINVKPKFGPFDFSMIVLLVLYAGFCYIGIEKNKQITLKFGEVFYPLLTRQFAQIGPDETTGFVKNGYHEFQLYCTGRINIHSALFTFQLQKRQDIIFFLVDNFLLDTKDTITIDFAIKNLDPIVFAISKKTEMSKMRRNCSDLTTYTDLYSDPPANFAISTPFSGIVDKIITPKILEFLNKNKEFFVSIHISDRNIFNKFQKNVRFIFNIPPKNEMNKMEELMEFMFIFIDTISTFKLTVSQAQKAKKIRDLENKKIKKIEQEAQEEKILEEKAKKRIEEEERISKMSDEKQRKYAEKERKKQLKKRGPKIKILK
ncbi:coiled-coil domain-containing protein [Anaeramoeba ignava]|uniref:Coiled-coil domain-containing protein n=1 Tax=Anaeramoeba ignava TaxID=1746090 RepID=A0A9Q0RCJ1_ANAIG|nr:coiled-coil domain-containing protein [Anaeramoeba ignava]